MKQKAENCKYCGIKLVDVKTTRKQFCCDLHRVYWNRDLKMETPKFLKDLTPADTSPSFHNNFGKVRYVPPPDFKKTNPPDLSKEEINEISERIKILKHELSNQPKNFNISKKIYETVRLREIDELEKKLLK